MAWKQINHNLKIPKVSHEDELNAYLVSQGLTLEYMSKDVLWTGYKTYGLGDKTTRMGELAGIKRHYARKAFMLINDYSFDVITKRTLYTNGNHTDSIDTIRLTIAGFTNHSELKGNPSELPRKVKPDVKVKPIEEPEIVQPKTPIKSWKHWKERQKEETSILVKSGKGDRKHRKAQLAELTKERSMK